MGDDGGRMMLSCVLIFHIIKAMAVSGFLLLVYAADAPRGKGPGAQPQGEITRIGFGSGSFQWGDQPIWHAASAAELDLFIFNGDAIYADFDGEKVFDVTEDILKRLAPYR
jgi:hypothetical protein